MSNLAEEQINIKISSANKEEKKEGPKHMSNLTLKSMGKNSKKNFEIINNNYIAIEKKTDLNVSNNNQLKKQNKTSSSNLMEIKSNEKNILRQENNNIFKKSVLTPKNNNKTTKINKTFNFDKIEKKTDLKKKPIDSDRINKNNNDSRNDENTMEKSNKKNQEVNLILEEKKDINNDKQLRPQENLSPVSNNNTSAKRLTLNKALNKKLKESRSSRQFMVKDTKIIIKNEPSTQISDNNKEKIDENNPIIDLATDMYEIPNTVEIDMAITDNSSIHNNSLLNSKNFDKSKNEILNNNLDFINDDKDDDSEEGNHFNFPNKERFRINFDEDSPQKYQTNSFFINDVTLNRNELSEKINKENYEVIELENKLTEDDVINLNKTNEKITKTNNEVTTPKNFTMGKNSLNQHFNHTIKFLKTNFESTRNLNTNFSLNNNKHLISKKSTKKNSIVNSHSLKNEDLNTKDKDKFPYSKTLKILKNSELKFVNANLSNNNTSQNIMNNVNINFNNGTQKGKSLLSFSKEKDDKKVLTFRTNKNKNYLEIGGETTKVNNYLKNSNSINSNLNSKYKIIRKDLTCKDINLNNDVKKSIENFGNLNNTLNNKFIIKNNYDVRDEIMKKPMSEDKNYIKRKINGIGGFKNLTENLKKDNMGFNTTQKLKDKANLSLNKNQVSSKKKFDIVESKKKIMTNVNFSNRNNIKENNSCKSDIKAKNNGASIKKLKNSYLTYENNLNNQNVNNSYNYTTNNLNNQNNYLVTINPMINNYQDKNLLVTKINNKKSNKNKGNLLDKKTFKDKNTIDRNIFSKTKKLNHNISQSISNSNIKITQNGISPDNCLNSSFKSNNFQKYNGVDISVESTDININSNLKENVKDKENIFQKKNSGSPPLKIAKKAITNILNRPVSEYRLIDLKNYNNSEDLIFGENVNYTENCEECEKKIPIRYQNILENNSNKKNVYKPASKSSGKNYEKSNTLDLNKNQLNFYKISLGRVNNNCYRNTLNININGNNNKKNVCTNMNNLIQFEKINSFNKGKPKAISNSKRGADSLLKKNEFDVKLNEASMSTTETSVFKGKIDDYLIGKEIGKGAYAIVKHANHKPTNRKFAIKIYEKVKLFDPEKKGSVKREIQILKKMDPHENIVKLIEVIETSRQILLVMDLVEGISLLDLLKSRENRRIDENECRKIFSQLVNAIAFCHAKNIIHRDIKLENIIVDSHFNLKLIDFGFGAVCSTNKLQNFFCGTPSYMPPEIVQKKDYIGYLADIWSLGILLFTLLCGAFPFKANSEKELYGKITKGIFTCPDHLSQSVCELIRRILIVRPLERPNAQEILNDKWFNSYYSHHNMVKDSIIVEENELNFNSKNN